jgi:hypothetical protein
VGLLIPKPAKKNMEYANEANVGKKNDIVPKEVSPLLFDKNHTMIILIVSKK